MLQTMTLQKKKACYYQAKLSPKAWATIKKNGRKSSLKQYYKNPKNHNLQNKNYQKKVMLYKTHYHGKIKCPKCQEYGYFTNYTRINTKTKSETPQGAQVKHCPHKWQDPTTTICYLTNEEAQKILESTLF
jgi:hypothetical protein